jgi:hypothetical protein
MIVTEWFIIQHWQAGFDQCLLKTPVDAPEMIAETAGGNPSQLDEFDNDFLRIPKDDFFIVFHSIASWYVQYKKASANWREGL